MYVNTSSFLENRLLNTSGSTCKSILDGVIAVFFVLSFQ